MKHSDNVRFIVLKADRLIVFLQRPPRTKRTLPETRNEIETKWMGYVEVPCVCVFVFVCSRETRSHDSAWIHICSLFVFLPT